jgi:hypothetical protein
MKIFSFCTYSAKDPERVPRKERKSPERGARGKPMKASAKKGRESPTEEEAGG